jgi:hypothetical protein
MSLKILMLRLILMSYIIIISNSAHKKVNKNDENDHEFNKKDDVGHEEKDSD